MKEFIFSVNRESNNGTTEIRYIIINKDSDKIIIQYYGWNNTLDNNTLNFEFNETDLTENKFYDILVSKYGTTVLSNIKDDSVFSAVNELMLSTNGQASKVRVYKRDNCLYFSSNMKVVSDTIPVFTYPLTEELKTQYADIVEKFELDIPDKEHSKDDYSNSSLIMNQPDKELKELYRTEQKRRSDISNYMANISSTMSLLTLNVQLDIVLSILGIMLKETGVKETLTTKYPELIALLDVFKNKSYLDYYSDTDSCAEYKSEQIDNLKELYDKI